MVSLAPTSYVPVASNVSLGTAGLAAPAITLQQFTNVMSPQTATIKLPSSIIGNCVNAATWRLIFTWKNDGSLGTPPPAAIDNISLISAMPTGALAGTYTVGPSGDYATLTAAVNDLGVKGVSAPVFLNCWQHIPAAARHSP